MADSRAGCGFTKSFIISCFNSAKRTLNVRRRSSPQELPPSSALNFPTTTPITSKKTSQTGCVIVAYFRTRSASPAHTVSPSAKSRSSNRLCGCGGGSCSDSACCGPRPSSVFASAATTAGAVLDAKSEQSPRHLLRDAVVRAFTRAISAGVNVRISASISGVRFPPPPPAPAPTADEWKQVPTTYVTIRYKCGRANSSHTRKIFSSASSADRRSTFAPSRLQVDPTRNSSRQGSILATRPEALINFLKA
mmetsp:Transcript_22552/g.57045  ORF Transcript_22552/g.57045 Transcript_22552/m.57045 type:complete len:250 (+) Transcript_22552:1323-2072(+)